MLTLQKTGPTVILLCLSSLMWACDSDSGESDETVGDFAAIQDSYSDPRVDAIVARIFKAIQTDDVVFSAQLGIAALIQQVSVGDSIGAVSEQIYGRYGPRAPDGPLIEWLGNMLDDFNRVRDQYPELCNGYMNGSPSALARLYDELFTVEDKIREVQIVESIVLGAIENPTEIQDFGAVEELFNELIDGTDQWATDNNVLDGCRMAIKLFETAQELDSVVTADLMRFNFTYE